MNKLEKFLAQSVTPEMVAERLTEQEIEEVIEEYETKIANAEDDIELAKEREQAMRKCAEQSLKRAEDWKHVVESEVGQVVVWRSVVNKAKQALKGKETSPNERRAKLIKEAKEYIKDHKYGLEAKLDRADKMVTVHDYGAVNKKYIYPPHLTWNKYIAKAWGMAKFNTNDELTHKFGIGAPQPTEIVEGMDVMLYYKPNGIKSLYARGVVGHYDKTSDVLSFSEVREKDTKAYVAEGDFIYGITSDGFKILSDTKAKYKEDEK